MLAAVNIAGHLLPTMEGKGRIPEPITTAPSPPEGLRSIKRSWLATLLTAVVLVMYHAAIWPWTPSPVRTNIILMISDGFGPASVTFSRHFHQALHNDTSFDSQYQTPLDTILIGTHRSRSSSSLITDSAAGATAFACAKKSYNGAIGVTADGKPCGTVFEAAKRRGLLTGVVVTSRLTDATPAAFISHAASRAEEPLIASQMIGGDKNPLGERTLDLAIGGGGCAFMPSSSPYSCRQDDEDTIDIAQQLGWDVRLAYPANASHHIFEGSAPKLPFMALLAPSNTPFEIDRTSMPARHRTPSLRYLTTKALDILARSDQNTKGFVLMIEGSQIDLCAHNNDPACHAREAIAYNEAIQTVKEWVDRHTSKSERSLLISTSDHETGGVTLGRQLRAEYPNYAYYPERLLHAKQSTPVLTAILIDFVRNERKKAVQLGTHVEQKRISAFIRNDILGAAGLGFEAEQQGGPPSKSEIARVLAAVNEELLSDGRVTRSLPKYHPSFDQTSVPEPAPPITLDLIRRTLSDIAATRAEIGFSTSGHTGLDINVYAHGYARHLLAGNQDNTNIGVAVQTLLKLDLEAVTRDLNK